MKLVLDTSVIIEYIIAESPWRPIVSKLFSLSLTDNYELYVSTVTLAETYYIAEKIYRAAGVHNPESAAKNLLTFLRDHPGIRVVEPTFEIALEAGVI